MGIFHVKKVAFITIMCTTGMCHFLTIPRPPLWSFYISVMIVIKSREDGINRGIGNTLDQPWEISVEK